MKRLVLAALLLMGLVVPGCSGDDAEQADTSENKRTKSGDHAATLREIQPLADQGDPQAQFDLGFMYTFGQGVRKDYEEGARWIRMAADQGHAQAQYNMGLNYELARGVPLDIVQAHVWYTLAGQQGYAAALEMRDDTASKMTADQLAEARRLVAEFHAKSAER